MEPVTRKSKNDNVSVLVRQVARLRRRTSRLKDMGEIPQEVSERILNYIIEIDRELEGCQR